MAKKPKNPESVKRFYLINSRSIGKVNLIIFCSTIYVPIGGLLGGGSGGDDVVVGYRVAPGVGRSIAVLHVTLVVESFRKHMDEFLCCPRYRMK